MKIETLQRLVFLDTNIVSKSIRKPSEKLERRMDEEWQAGTRFLLSAVVLHEIEVSALRSENPVAARDRVSAFMRGVTEVVTFEAKDALASAKIHADLLSRGLVIGGYDTLIAAQALQRNLPLITNNVREFSRVSGLIWEDWTI